MNIKSRKWKDIYMIYYLTIQEIKILSIQNLTCPTIQNGLNKLWPLHENF